MSRRVRKLKAYNKYLSSSQSSSSSEDSIGDKHTPDNLGGLYYKLVAVLDDYADKAGLDREEKTSKSRSTAHKSKKQAPTRTASTTRIKGPRNAYIFFCQDKRKQLNKDTLEAGMTITKQLGKMWKELDEASRQKYTIQAEEDKDRYEREIKRLKDD